MAQRHWTFWYQYFAGGCAHGNECKARSEGYECTTGQRNQPLHLITGDRAAVDACLALRALAGTRSKPSRTRERAAEGLGLLISPDEGSCVFHAHRG